MPKNLQTALELFHIARRDVQIRDRLYQAWNHYRSRLDKTGDLLCEYASWKVGDYLKRDVKLYVVSAMTFCEPGAMDLKPQFLYRINAVCGVAVDGTITYQDYSETLYPDRQKHYRTVSEQELKEFKKTLPVVRKKRSRANG